MAARVVSGAWKRANQQTYSGATVWGTGINPVHAQYGAGAPLRVTGRNEDAHTAPGEAVPDDITQRELWGYTTDDQPYYSGVDYDHRPPLGISTADSRYSSYGYPPVNADGAQHEQFRDTVDGARSDYQDRNKQIPTETVSEGWLNKPEGDLANANPSDPSQYEIQTSMRQRYLTRDNNAAVSRNTDAARTSIASRVAGQKLKVYSGQQRHYDMMPRQQDAMPRAFYYRTAGTGRARDMLVNAQADQVPIQRVPPADPALGAEETSLTDTYGYTGEDIFYA